MLVGDIVTSNSRLFPHKMGIISQKVRLSWSQFNDRVNRLANAMLGLGMKKGDRVAIISENCHEYAVFLFANAKAGLISVCLNHQLTAEQLIRIMNDCEPKALFAQDKFVDTAEQINSAVKSIKSIVGIGRGHGCRNDYEALLAEQPADEPDVKIDEQDIYRLQYTTGTTGTSKGVLLTHKNEITNCMMRLQATPTFRDDIVLEWAPLFAVGPQARFFGTCFLGATIVIIVFEPKSFVEMVEKERITYSSLLPVTTFKMIRDYLAKDKYKHDLTSLRKLQAAGGQHCSGSELKEMLDYFGISYSHTCIAYGMTEACGPATYLVPEDIVAGLSPSATVGERERVDSIGKPLLNCKIRVVDDNDNDVPPGQIGEILLKGDQIMKGYWKNPELTRTALRGGWFHTSDLGRLDDDNYLYFEGRKDSVIKSGGFLVGPEEVEKVIMQHPAVSDVAVVGISHEKWGQVVTAVVRLESGQITTEEEIRDHCRKSLAAYQIPKSVSFTDRLPRDLAYGKICRKELFYQK